MKLGRNDPCGCGSNRKYKKCCLDSPFSPWGPNAQKSLPSKPTLLIRTKSQSAIVKMRAAGKLAAQVLAATGELVKPGVSTQELNDFAHRMTIENKAFSAPLGYKVRGAPPFPRSICTSVNNVVCHGIPSSSVTLKEGDIVNCDITVKLNGYHGDTSRTFYVGEVSNETRVLVQTTKKAMEIGIQAIQPGGCISDIGKAIEGFINPLGYGIVRELTGHGIGKKFHEDPPIYHFAQDEITHPIVPGMIFTVEPMINIGSPEVQVLDDLWTVITADKSWSAQFEHTCLVTETGVEILTLLER